MRRRQLYAQINSSMDMVPGHQKAPQPLSTPAVIAEQGDNKERAVDGKGLVLTACTKCGRIASNRGWLAMHQKKCKGER